ncbi:hypothetical protein D3C80_1802660 [compost metagenome]
MKTKVVHSETKSAWNVISDSGGQKFKIARCPYYIFNDDECDSHQRKEALKHARFISDCFNKYYDNEINSLIKTK